MFARVSTAYFCGFDDFGESHRAVFEDARHPSHIFTTTHFGGTKYRPFNRLSTYMCWMLGGGSALPFRLRNLFFHLLCSVCVYGIAWQWTHDRKTCLSASLLFCLSPAANQTVVAAIFTNTTAYALLLAGFLLFLYWLRFTQWPVLAASMFLILIALFFYEPTIVVFAMMLGYLLLSRKKRHELKGRQIAAWLGISSAVLLTFAVARHSIVHGGNSRVPLLTILQNTAMYAGDLLVPVDPVLASRLFGTPLPPTIHLGRTVLLFVLLLFVALVAAGAALFPIRVIQSGFRQLDKSLAIFLTASIVAVLAPFLLFAPHPSETYLYLPAALYALLLSLLFRAFLSSSEVAYGIVLAFFLLCYAGGTWVRNEKVAQCGAVAARILEQLPVEGWKVGQNNIRLANAPGEVGQRHYGIYLYHGLSTIERGEPGDSPAAMYALQLATKNSQLRVEVVDPLAMANSCSIPRTCFWVYSDGSVQEVISASIK